MIKIAAVLWGVLLPVVVFGTLEPSASEGAVGKDPLAIETPQDIDWQERWVFTHSGNDVIVADSALWDAFELEDSHGIRATAADAVFTISVTTGDRSYKMPPGGEIVYCRGKVVITPFDSYGFLVGDRYSARWASRGSSAFTSSCRREINPANVNDMGFEGDCWETGSPVQQGCTNPMSCSKSGSECYLEVNWSGGGSTTYTWECDGTNSAPEVENCADCVLTDPCVCLNGDFTIS